jgi:alkylation response protein AidB-like acyl-CoA dehydrogenase
MNFEFSGDAMMLRDQAHGFLRSNCDSKVIRRVHEGHETYAAALWRKMADMGWLGAAIPEQFGGTGLGYELLCIIAEEVGRVIAPVPLGSSIYLAAEAILAAGTVSQKERWLPSVADGSRIGTIAVQEGIHRPAAEAIRAHASNGLLSGDKWPVPGGSIADFAIVAARDVGGIGLYRVDLAQPAVERQTLHSLDSSRPQARIFLNGARGERLGDLDDHWPLVRQVLDRAAILMAFEQVGGAEACLHMARDYALERTAFGRPIGSFQAIKHKLADIYVEVEIARSNAYFGAWALSEDRPELALAASAARLAAIEAFGLAAKENIQIHGGAGFTWDLDCHLYYRRAKILALELGGAPFWMARLMDQLEAAEASRENSRGL